MIFTCFASLPYAITLTSREVSIFWKRVFDSWHHLKNNLRKSTTLFAIFGKQAWVSLKHLTNWNGHGPDGMLLKVLCQLPVSTFVCKWPVFSNNILIVRYHIIFAVITWVLNEFLIIKVNACTVHPLAHLIYSNYLSN